LKFAGCFWLQCIFCTSLLSSSRFSCSIHHWEP
jgi:hypothetical protein